MAFTNDVRLIGYCGTMPTLRQTRVGRSICFLPIYTEHWAYTGGERKTYKERHCCVFSGKNAERAHRLLMTGSQVYIRGANHYRKIEKDGQVTVEPQIIVEDFMITTKATVTKELYDHIFHEEASDKTQKNALSNSEKDEPQQEDSTAHPLVTG